MTRAARLPLRWLATLLLLAGSLLAAGAAAHEVRPAYLELRESGAERWSVLFKVPMRGDRVLRLAPRLPENCRPAAEPRAAFVPGAQLTRSEVVCEGGIEGRPISVDGLSATLTDVLVRIERANGAVQTGRLEPTAGPLTVDADPSRLDVARTYLVLGIEHILLGIDHLLFVLALLLIVHSFGRLVATVTAFTVAHSITLAAATLGFVHVPGPPVETAIALSIVFVAAEIVHGRRGRPGLTERAPWIVAFSFGLLHGFGFAGALSEVGLPQSSIPLALLAFNVGVEVGQLAFVAAVLAAWALTRPLLRRLPAYAIELPAYAIGALAAYWTLDRLTGF